MEFQDFLNPFSILPQLSSTEKPQAIDELVEALLDAFPSQFNVEKGDMVAEILDREALATTGVGMGVALPHIRLEGSKKMLGALGVSKEGIEFQSLDGEKVHLLFLLVSPVELPGDHLRAMDTIVRFCQSNDRDDLLSSNNLVEMLDILGLEASANSAPARKASSVSSPETFDQSRTLAKV